MYNFYAIIIEYYVQVNWIIIIIYTISTVWPNKQHIVQSLQTILQMALDQMIVQKIRQVCLPAENLFLECNM